jgi:hypothetical protein
MNTATFNAAGDYLLVAYPVVRAGLCRELVEIPARILEICEIPAYPALHKQRKSPDLTRFRFFRRWFGTKLSNVCDVWNL